MDYLLVKQSSKDSKQRTTNLKKIFSYICGTWNEAEEQIL